VAESIERQGGWLAVCPFPLLTKITGDKFLTSAKDHAVLGSTRASPNSNETQGATDRSSTSRRARWQFEVGGIFIYFLTGGYSSLQPRGSGQTRLSSVKSYTTAERRSFFFLQRREEHVYTDTPVELSVKSIEFVH
jgi:hypothetical protein